VERVGATTIFPVTEGSVLEEVDDVYLMAFRAGPGMIEPTVTSGRAPRGPGEVLLTRDVLRGGGYEIGDTVTLHGLAEPEDGGRPQRTSIRTHIVGVGVLPIGDGRVDTGASITAAGLRRLQPGNPPGVALFDLADGADAPVVVERLVRLGFQDPLSSEELDLLELVDLDVDPARATPRLLAALLVALAAGIVVHVIITIARVRRRDVAILRSVGFTPRQVRTSAVWQAGALALVAGLVALVIGITGGRALWRVYATRLDIAPEPAIAWFGIGLVILALAAVCLVMSLAMARQVLRRRPGAELRAE
jgi:hypothetical protein